MWDTYGSLDPRETEPDVDPCSDVWRTQEEQVSSTLATTSQPDAKDHRVEFILDESCKSSVKRKTYAKFRDTATPPLKTCSRIREILCVTCFGWIHPCPYMLPSIPSYCRILPMVLKVDGSGFPLNPKPSILNPLNSEQ